MGAAAAAVVALVGGATWRGLAADTSADIAAPQVQTAPAASQFARAALGGRDTYADVVKMAGPAVVTVQTTGRARLSPTGFNGEDEELFRRFFGRQFEPGQGRQIPRAFRQRGLGSGVVVSADGYILTNNHVIDRADEISVEFQDGRTFKATLIGADKPSDLAVLKVEATNLPAMALGDSDAVQVGDLVLAFGNPLGIGQTVTMGIISAKGRSTSRGDGSYEDFLQTDAPINHGNSGGALVNTKGELVGINSQIVSPSEGNVGIGFAIPVNMARHVMDDLRKEGRVRRAQLGVTVQPVTADMAESLGLKEVGGAIVSSVGEGSAAERAGLKRGDVITSFNGQPVRDFNSLRNRVADMAPGASASIGIVRDGSPRTLNVMLDEAEGSRSAQRRGDTTTGDKAVLGVAVVPLTPESAVREGLPRSARGMLVQDVDPNGRAADAGIEAGDVIVEVNRQPVQTIEELRAAVQKSGDRPTLLLVSRDGKDLFVTVKAS
jgi:Do/DeqQ family serine protease